MTLTTIHFRDNKFQNFTKLIAALSKLVNLRNIDASFNMFNGKIPEYAFRRHQSLTFINLRNNKFNFIEQKSFGSLSKLQYLDLSNNRIKMVSSGAFYALKTLTTLSFVGNSLLHQGEFEMSNYQLNNFSSLTTLTLGSRAFQNIGLPNSPHLESLHIANGQLPCCVKLFRENVRLEYLTLLEIQNVDFISHNEMGAIVNTDVINVQPRQCLRFLRLPNNNFKHLNFTSLNEFQNLEELLLTNNQLSFIHGVPNKLNKLASLDLSSNLITVLSPEIVTLLPSLRSLKVYDNPFDCTCKMKPFTDWLRKDQNVNVYHGGTRRKQNTCSLPRAQYGVSIDLIELGLECNLVFMISLPLTCFIVVVVIIAALVKRFHWRTHLAYFLFKLRPGGYNLQINDEEQAQNKKYDAFVVYNQHDSDWVIHELVPHLENIDPPNFKLCIHERDFIPGNDIFENVLDSIEQSKKTMLILSPDFAASEWCYFETRMVHRCLIEEKRDIIIMVSLKRIPDDEMPRILRNILLIKNYLEWPENEIGRKLFWEKLKVALRSDCKAKRVPDL
ncbi:toll-like receptor 2 [Ptychodera flava]|uniref:toll-like receptor 2 n=1 Tax=Ptychodera flava TaxID=63121 RepID=UPI003969E21F